MDTESQLRMGMEVEAEAEAEDEEEGEDELDLEDGFDTDRTEGSTYVDTPATVEIRRTTRAQRDTSELKENSRQKRKRKRTERAQPQRLIASQPTHVPVPETDLDDLPPITHYDDRDQAVHAFGLGPSSYTIYDLRRHRLADAEAIDRLGIVMREDGIYRPVLRRKMGIAEGVRRKFEEMKVDILQGGEWAVYPGVSMRPSTKRGF